MDTGFAIKEYHNVAEIYAGIDKLVKNPIRPIKRDEMDKNVQGFSKKYASSKPVIDEAMDYIPGGVQHNLAFKGIWLQDYWPWLNIGIIVAMLVTPALVGSNPDLPDYGSGFGQMPWIYGVISLLAAIACLILLRERPKGVDAEASKPYPFFKGLGHILHNRDMLITMFLFLIGLGIFNAISSMTNSIAAEAGVEDSDGLIGGLMLIGGILGAIIIPGLSDKMRKRKPFILLCIVGMLPAVAGMSFAGQIAPDPQGAYTISLISSFILGFFVMSAGPIGFQYAAEVSHPAPESASQGILLWVGQLTGMIFVTGMSMKINLYLGSFVAAFTVMAALAIAAAFSLRESPVIRISAKENI